MFAGSDQSVAAYGPWVSRTFPRRRRAFPPNSDGSGVPRVRDPLPVDIGLDLSSFAATNADFERRATKRLDFGQRQGQPAGSRQFSAGLASAANSRPVP